MAQPPNANADTNSDAFESLLQEHAHDMCKVLFSPCSVFKPAFVSKHAPKCASFKKYKYTV